MEKTRYSDEELQEFKTIILDKLGVAQSELAQLQDQLQTERNHSLKALEEGAMVYSREEAAHQLERQLKFVTSLQNALLRIENGTYGICRKTGKLIPKERLRAVPHATLCIEAKQ